VLFAVVVMAFFVVAPVDVCLGDDALFGSVADFVAECDAFVARYGVSHERLVFGRFGYEQWHRHCPAMADWAMRLTRWDGALWMAGFGLPPDELPGPYGRWEPFELAHGG
jgi:hypothetical protein